MPCADSTVGSSQLIVAEAFPVSAGRLISFGHPTNAIELPGFGSSNRFTTFVRLWVLRHYSIKYLSIVSLWTHYVTSTIGQACSSHRQEVTRAG